MADLTVTASAVRPASVIEQQISGAGGTITAGQVVRFDGTTGKIITAQADLAGNAGAIGIAINGTAETGMRPTVVRRGILDVGNALNALAYGASVYLSNTAGTLADAAGTVSLVVGTVVPGYGNTTPDKLLRVSL